MDALKACAEMLGHYVLEQTAPLLVAVVIGFIWLAAKSVLQALNRQALPALAKVLIVSAEQRLTELSGPEKMEQVIDWVLAALPHLGLKRDVVRAYVQAVFDLLAGDPAVPAISGGEATP